jgi:hypothetical protein
MDLSLSTRAIKNLFSFPFHDPKWRSKFLIGAGITLSAMIIPILPLLIVWGYIARLIRAGAANEDAAHLPEWEDWGDLMMDGLRQLGIVLVFILPSVVVLGAGWLFYMVGILSISGVENGSSAAGGRIAFMLFSMLIFFASMGISMLLSLAAWLVMPAAQAHAAIQRRFAAAFDVAGWWPVLRTNFSGFIIGAGLFVVLEILLMIVFQFLYMTLVLCLFAPLILFPASFYIMIIVYRVIGQAYGEGSQKVRAKSSVPIGPAPLIETPGTI